MLICLVMEPDKYKKAIAISVSAFGYNQLKKEQEGIVLNFIFGCRSQFYLGSNVFAVVPTGFGKSLCYTCLSQVFSSKKDHRSPQQKQTSLQTTVILICL